MKTNFSQIILFLSFIFILLNAQNANSQGMSCTPGTPYQIIDSRACDVTVFYEISDCSVPQIVCFATVIIPAGSTYNIPNTCCVNGTGDVYVWLKEIDYIDVSAQWLATSGACLTSQGTIATGTAPSSCPPIATTVTHSIWNTTIN